MTESHPQDRPRWKKILSVVLNLTLFAALFMGIKTYQKRDLLDTEAEPAPAFTLRDLDGHAYKLAEHTGKTVLLFFFAPWCTVCKSNVADLNDLMEKIDPQTTTVLSVALGYENREEVIGFHKRYKVTFPVLLGNKRIQQDYRVSAFPTTYIIAPDGRIADSYLGYTPGILFNWALP